MNRDAAIGWDHPETARFYESFDRRHARYRAANRILATKSALKSGLRVLDVAAGGGGTARAALGRVGRGGRIVCFEPADAMRTLGRKSLRDPRVQWTREWPETPASFDRILCGAAIWQMRPLEPVLGRCFDLLRRGGALAFNLPSLYLGEPDEPGGGDDPHLAGIPTLLASGRGNSAPATTPLDADQMEDLLRGAGFRANRWTFVLKIGQRAYRDWLKIPPATDGILVGLDPLQREAAIDGAYRSVDARSWRRERWTGWTAWKPAP